MKNICAVVKKHFQIVAFLLGSIGILLIGPAKADTFPDRPIQFIVPVAPGGFSDVLARVTSQYVSASIGKPVVVINMPAGGGIQAAARVAQSPADGYTIMLGIPGTHVMNIGLRPKLQYKASDFDSVVLLSKTPNVLVHSPTVRFDSVEGLMRYVKENPGKIFYGSTGMGGTPHLAMELWKEQAGLAMTHVPYAGSALALTALIRGDVQIMIDNLVFQAPHIKAGKSKALAVLTPVRSQIMPEIPTMAEKALPGFTAETWFGIFAAAGTPRPIVERLAEEFSKALKLPEVAAALAGAELIGGTPSQFDSYLDGERKKWLPLIERAGIRAE